MEAFADALLVVPKILAENSGLDTQDVIIELKVISYIQVLIFLGTNQYNPSLGGHVRLINGIHH